MKITWVEILVIMIIVAILAMFAIRVMFGGQMLEWEYNMIES